MYLPYSLDACFLVKDVEWYAVGNDYGVARDKINVHASWRNYLAPVVLVFITRRYIHGTS